jgi:hypothetical protein
MQIINHALFYYIRHFFWLFMFQFPIIHLLMIYFVLLEFIMILSNITTILFGIKILDICLLWFHLFWFHRLHFLILFALHFIILHVAFLYHFTLITYFSNLISILTFGFLITSCYWNFFKLNVIFLNLFCLIKW